MGKKKGNDQKDALTKALLAKALIDILLSLLNLIDKLTD